MSACHWNQCKEESVWLASFSDGCQSGYCTRHRDSLLSYLDINGEIGCSVKNHPDVSIVKWELAA